jgi:hypothetical protein
MAAQAKARTQAVAPPYDHDAERMLLTVALAFPPAIDACAALRPEWLHHAEYRPIWRAMLAMAKRDEIATIETIENELKVTGHYDAAGGFDGIMNASSGSHDNAGAFTTPGARSFARAIMECARGRVETELAEKLAPIGYGRRDGGLAIIEQYRGMLAEIGNAILALEGKARIATLVPKGQTARELMAKNIPAPQWAVPGLFAAGLTLFAGKPKRGKSTLSLQIVLAVASGGRALGQIPVDQRETLYLALEDNERRMQRRMQRMLDSDDGSTVPDGLHIFYQWPRLDAGCLDHLDAWMEEHPKTGLVIIDTYARIKAQAQKNATLYDADYSGIAPLQAWATQRDVAVIVVHHLRKSANPDDPMDEISGSTGLTGAVDNLVVMRTVDNVTVLSRRGRDYLDDEDWGLRGDPMTLLWTLEGNAYDVRRSSERNAILDVLDRYPDGLSPADIARELGKTPSTVRSTLYRMLHGGDGSLTKIGSLYKREKSATGATPATGATGATPATHRGESVAPLHLERVGATPHATPPTAEIVPFPTTSVAPVAGVAWSHYFDHSGPGRYEPCRACGGCQWGLVNGETTCMKCRTQWTPRRPGA